MAKITQRKVRLGITGLDKEMFRETTVNIYYDATTRETATYSRHKPAEDQRFYMKLPKIVADALGICEVRAADQYKVFDEFIVMIEKFKALKTETHKIIAYHIDVDPKPGKSRDKYGSSRRDIQVWAGVYIETVATAGDGVERCSYEAEESPANFDSVEQMAGRSIAFYMPSRGRDGNRHEDQIPWTKRNEDFFVWIRENMDLLITKLHEIEQPDKILEIIEAGSLLPLGNKQEG